MAKRPIFTPNLEGHLVSELRIEFKWYPGMSIQQKRKSIASLHESASLKGIYPILEISTKSTLELGKALSAFNLFIRISNAQSISVEAAYQGGKIFEKGGPYRDLYGLPGRQIKTDERLRNSGKLIAFDLDGKKWPLEPKTIFYDWLYVSALNQNLELSNQLLDYKGFSDIEFNPEKSINCQARAAALFVALQKRNLLDLAISSQKTFILVAKTGNIANTYIQANLL